jgi:Tfp pilus assembly protein PilN
VLRTNLSTRPFYNERAVHLVLGVIAAIVAAVTVVNLYEVIQLSRRSADYASRVGRDRSEADRLSREAARIRRGIDQTELATIVAAAQEANGLIDQRTFSWTAFFNEIESTMPPDVMLASVRPTITDEGTQMRLVLLGRNSEELDEFMEKLEATGAFPRVMPHQQDETDEGLHRLEIDATYVPAADAEPASTEKPEAEKPKPQAPPKTKPGAAPATKSAATKAAAENLP